MTEVVSIKSTIGAMHCSQINTSEVFDCDVQCTHSLYEVQLFRIRIHYYCQTHAESAVNFEFSSTVFCLDTPLGGQLLVMLCSEFYWLVYFWFLSDRRLTIVSQKMAVIAALKISGCKFHFSVAKLPSAGQLNHVMSLSNV